MTPPSRGDVTDLRLLLDSIVDHAIYALDARGHVSTWNRGAERTYGYAAEEILGRHVATFYTPEDWASGRPASELTLASAQGHFEEQAWRVRKDGSRFWANVVVTALRADDGTLVGFGKVIRDLSRQRAADDALRHSEERFRLMVESVADYAIFMLDPEGTILTWNEGAHRLKQYDADEIIGRHFSVFYPPEATHRSQELLAEAVRNGRVEDEGWRVRRDGTRFWADVVITALRDGSGELRGFAKVTRDQTERWQAEEALRQSEERFRLMVESVVDYAIFMLDPDGRVTTWNEGAHRLKQYDADEIIGRHFSIFYPPEASHRSGELLAEAVRHGRVEDEGWRVRKDGSRFWADVVITALRGAEGELRGFAKVTRDLTERKRAEDALRDVAQRERDAADQLRQADRAKQELVAVVAHDLRAPVGVLHGTVDMLLNDWERLDDTTRRRMLQMMRGSTVRLRSLVDDTLDVARIEAGQMRYATGEVDLVAAVRRAVRDVDPEGCRISISAPDHPVIVHGDEVRLWQASTNLLTNALKFSAPDQPVQVTITVGAGTVTTAVTDHGIGIAAEDQQRLWQRFARVNENRGTAATGTGLGLYITQSVIRAQGGDVSVVSTPGEGSTFSFTLPCRS